MLGGQWNLIGGVIATQFLYFTDFHQIPNPQHADVLTEARIRRN
jgi:hypothetical protein